MIRTKWSNAFALLLCLPAVWLGTELAGHRKIENDVNPTTAPARKGRMMGGDPPSALKIPSASREMRKLVSRTESDALWECVSSPGLDPDEASEWLYLALDELIAREGAGIWKRAMAMEDLELRFERSNWILDRFASKDPWLAYEMFLEKREAFGENWGLDGVGTIMIAAAGISAERFIEVMEKSAFTETDMNFYEEFAPGFDFETLVNHLETSEKKAAGVPGNLIEKWAAVSPLAAARWVAGLRDVEGRHDRDRDYLTLPAVIKSIVKSKNEHRDEALAELSNLSAAEVRDGWLNVAKGSQGKLSAEMISAATQMNQREMFLTDVLLETRGQRSYDSSWLLIPVDERRAILKRAEMQWAENAPSPVDQRAREAWRARLEKELGF